jgi:hypothetical protein
MREIGDHRIDIPAGITGISPHRCAHAPPIRPAPLTDCRDHCAHTNG